MRIAVVDDEREWQIREEKYIWKHYGGGVTVDCFFSGEEFLREEELYSIVFMDVELPGMDGFEASRRYLAEHTDFLLIIMTTHTELAMKGYQVSAFRYIDKFHIEEMEEALSSADQRLRKFLRIPIDFVNGGVMEVCCHDILYAEAANHRAKVRVKGELCECREGIGRLEDKLRESGFYLIHRAYLVNMDHIRQLGRREVVLKGGLKLPVSRYKEEAFHKTYMLWKYENANG